MRQVLIEDEEYENKQSSCKDGKRMRLCDKAAQWLTRTACRDGLVRIRDEGDIKDINGGKILTKYIPIRFITRNRIEEIDRLTGEVYRRFNFTDRELAIAQSKFFEKDGGLYLVATEGTSNAISDFSKVLKLKVSMRRRISFNEDFLEYLNTAKPHDKGYSEVFKEDMISVRRKGRLMKHTLDERYPDPNDREQHINLQFREAAGVKITPPINLSSALPTMEVVVFNKDWMSLSQPSHDSSETVFYESVIYCYKRLSQAFEAYRSII